MNYTPILFASQQVYFLTLGWYGGSMKAQDFTLPDQDGKMHKLSDYLGKWVVLYFYPEDDTPGCTTEACSFRDNLYKLTYLGVVILGVSPDSVESHKKFHEKYRLNFTILADPEKKVHDAYHITSRTTYLIDPEGEIKKVYEKVHPEKHVEEILKGLQIVSS